MWWRLPIIGSTSGFPFALVLLIYRLRYTFRQGKDMHRLIISLFVCLLVTACSTTDVEEELSERQYYEEAQQALENEQYNIATEKLEALDARYPFGRYAEQGKLDMMYAYFQSSDFLSAGATAERFIRMHPDHAQLDYAYYMKGLSAYTADRSLFDRFIPSDLSERDLLPIQEAFNDFSRLLNRFPSSKYAPDARKRMVYLRNLLADHELRAARWYMRRTAYVAAINRARYVVENFDRTPAMPESLAIMHKAYRELGLDDLAKESLRVLANNYPDYPELAADGTIPYEPGKAGRQTLLSVVTFGLID
jgi:outer membrane protein assembly factor BamD